MSALLFMLSYQAIDKKHCQHDGRWDCCMISLVLFLLYCRC